MTRHYAPPPPKPPQRTGSAFDILKEIAERRAQLAASPSPLASKETAAARAKKKD
ncbi:hypothetical protein ACFIQG_20230 [Comamonas odontotermitis]|uniref:hypothetical protein n=1 Tax=Comamonas odontotermitis TaxID=379895 RepID=UPI00366F8299